MKFIMMIGLPGSGKTTIAKELAAKEKNSIILSSDSIREELFGNEAVQSDPATVFELMRKRTIENLNNNKTVIYDATNITTKSRKNIMNNIKKYDCPKIAIIVARPYEDCLKMNAQRKRVVPENAIYRMYTNFRMPYYYEGFTDIKIKYPNILDKGKYGSCLNTPALFKNYNQDNDWHPETLGQHLIDVYNRLEGKTDDPVLYEAALLHDCGKPFTAAINPKTGRHSFYNHANVGAYMSMFYSDVSDPIRVGAIISYHNDTLEWFTNPKAEAKFKLRDNELYQDLKIFTSADHPYENNKSKYKTNAIELSL